MPQQPALGLCHPPVLGARVVVVADQVAEGVGEQAEEMPVAPSERVRFAGGSLRAEDDGAEELGRAEGERQNVRGAPDGAVLRVVLQHGRGRGKVQGHGLLRRDAQGRPEALHQAGDGRPVPRQRPGRGK